MPHRNLAADQRSLYGLDKIEETSGLGDLVTRQAEALTDVLIRHPGVFQFSDGACFRDRIRASAPCPFQIQRSADIVIRQVISDQYRYPVNLQVLGGLPIGLTGHNLVFGGINRI